MGNFLGGIAGDIIGSVYEWHNVKNVDEIDFFSEGCRVTDDSVLTCAVAEWLMAKSPDSDDKEILEKCLDEFGHSFPNAGYGHMFWNWLSKEKKEPINSFGNGAGMRVSPVGYWGETMEEVKHLAKVSAEVTHNHPEGIKGAQAIAAAIFMARKGFGKEAIKKEIEESFGYSLNGGITDIVTFEKCSNKIIESRAHKFDATCQVTVPEAIKAFLWGTDFEDVIKQALIIGGDSDTIADMAGAIAAAYYGMPQYMQEETLERLPDKLRLTVNAFENAIINRF